MAFRARSLLIVSSFVVACGEAPSPHTPVTSGATSASATATGSAPVLPPTASATGSAPTVVPPPDAPTVTREQAVALADRAIAPDVVARNYPPTKLSRAERWTALGEIGVKYKSTVTDVASLATFVAWLKTRKEVEDAGVKGKSVWGRFVDGRMFVFTATPKGSPTVSAVRADLEEPAFETRGAKTLPRSKTAIGIDTVGAYPADNEKMVGYMSDVGHDAHAHDGSARVTVPFLATAVAGQALLSWNSHGGFGQEKDGTERYVLQTATPVVDCKGNRLVLDDLKKFQEDAKCLDADYDEYWKNGELAYTSATIWSDRRLESELTAAWTYALTSRFVRNRFTLAPHAIVVLDACQSGTAAATEMRGAFLAKGADVVLAWDNDVKPDDGIRTARATWLMLLGAFANDKNYDLTPRLRPWDLDGVQKLLKGWQWDRSTPEGGVMAFYRPTPSNANVVAVGSIKSLDVDESNQRLTLNGDFGDDRPANAKVTIHGADCPITSFAKDKIECDLGADFKTGDVVFLADGRKSNAVPLTGWKLQGDYVAKFPQQGGGNFAQSWHLEAHFRGDVHKHRDAATDKEGKEQEPFAVMGAHTSSCTPVGAGFKSAGAAGNVAGTTGAAMKETYGRPNPTATCILVGRIDPAAHTIAVGFMAMGGTGGINLNVPGGVHVPSPPGIVLDEMKDTTVPVSYGAGQTAASLNAVTFSFDASWLIGARRSPSKKVGPGGEIYFELPATPAEKDSVPTDKTPQ